MLPGQNRYWHLDLAPEQVVCHDHRYTRHDLHEWGPRKCFAEHNLYTTKWGEQESVDIEKFFFGRVDTEGKFAVEFFSDFQFDVPDQEQAYHGLMNYMSVQKLRTPKGLAWLSGLPGGRDRNLRLMMLQSLQNLFCAIWTDCVWQIADATQSPTKFITSDHPVTVYNRGCFPASKWCTGFNDPDIRMVATHTYFPLSLDKILILTNLSWIRNPYQKEINPHPNLRYFHNTVFKFTDIQIYRSLSEQEVWEINYVTKKRALRYVAAAEQEWLHPESHLPTTHWSKFGRGLLFMPEPREIHMGGEIIVGYKGGAAESWNEYGQRPWEKGYTDDERDAEESKTLRRFQAEWAAIQGPAYRGTSFQFDRAAKGPYITPDEFHQHDLERARRYRNGRRATR
jgi:hypothetical protein